jgi:hypothetical protein
LFEKEEGRPYVDVSVGCLIEHGKASMFRQTSATSRGPSSQRRGSLYKKEEARSSMTRLRFIAGIVAVAPK